MKDQNIEDLKIEILNTFIPRAVLLPLTKESIFSLPNAEKFIPIRTFPFCVGRESRLSKNERGLFVKLRIIPEKNTPNNDLYLIDNKGFLEISKEHFEITIKEDNYILKDRESSNGTILNNTRISQDENFERILKDGDIIQIGSTKSVYKFQFLTLEL